MHGMTAFEKRGLGAAWMPLLGALLGLGVGCTTFSDLDPPEALVQDASPPDEDGGPEDSGPGDSGPMMGPPFTLVDSCFDEPELVELGATPKKGMFSPEGLGDELRDFSSSSCGIESQPGIDGFFAADFAAGDRVHFMAVPTSDEQDVSVYYLREACDPGACAKALDKCGAGATEHSNFIIEEGGRYILGVDVDAPEPAPFKLMAVMPRCGDGTRKHGENCDDGNLRAGDGCDSKCRTEILGASGSENERNDDVLEANVLVIDSGFGTKEIAGEIGGGCDVDRFAVDVPDGATVNATVFDSAGQPCNDGAPDINMRLMEGTERGETLGTGGTGGTGAACPSIDEGDAFATAVGEGEYHIVLQAPSSAEQFEYTLEVEVTAASGT